MNNINWANHIEAASKIEPEQLITYLSKHGWTQFQGITRPMVKIYQKIVLGGLYQVTVPMDRKLGDYNTAMLSAVVEITDSDEAKQVDQLIAKLTSIIHPEQRKGDKDSHV
jgi:hypothetical protein